MRALLKLLFLPPRRCFWRAKHGRSLKILILLTTLTIPTTLSTVATVYDTPYDFTFITVRGGRHEVPETQPERAMAFFSYFLDGTPF